MNDANAESALSGFSPVLSRLEAHTHLSLSYDQGREMASHQRLTDAPVVRGYFADPRNSWYHGITEHTNSLLRQYLASGRDVSGFTLEELDTMAWTQNTRHRKSLGFKCPAELFPLDTFDSRQSIMLFFCNYSGRYSATLGMNGWPVSAATVS